MRKRVRDVTKWHRWFAWHPIYTGGWDGEWIWLEWVERRHVPSLMPIMNWKYQNIGAETVVRRDD